MAKPENKGFTLVEIMVVVGIVALLLSVVIPSMLNVRKAANETNAQATLKSFSAACELYAAANAALYPAAVSDLISDFFPYDPTGAAPRQGYTFTVTFAGNGYTATATALSNAANWDYQVTTGIVFKRSEPGEDNWQAF